MSKVKFSKARKYIRLDGWRGYYQPRFAIAGASDTGSWSDSPCPSGPVKTELGALARVLRKLGHSVAMTRGGTSNAFCGKRWLIVPPEQHEAAIKAVGAYMEKEPTRHIYEAD